MTAGIGNDGATEGAWRGKILGTYSHGPALARNPALADLLLRWATGADTLAPLDDTWPDRLRGERLAAAAARMTRPTGRRTVHDRRHLGRYAGMTDILIAPRGSDLALPRRHVSPARRTAAPTRSAGSVA